MHIRALGDTAFLIRLDNRISPAIHARVMALYFLLKSKNIPGVLDLVPAYCDLKVQYNPEQLDHATLYRLLKELPKEMESGTAKPSVLHEVPVVYGGSFGPDFNFLMGKARVSAKKLIQLHTEKNYLIYMLGFTPGFPYLGGMNKRIACERKDKPALRVPAGSVGIAGIQTGIYPIESPGGWQIIGRTPLKIFHPEGDDPFRLKPGDHIRFFEIQESEFKTAAHE